MRPLLPSLCAASLVAAASAAAAARPNIIFILADDLGHDGVGCYGSDHHKTPHIDALAKAGIRFQNAYASPLCGPTRALLMTGRYAFRTGGITNQSWRPGGPGPKSADEYPMARIMKDAGYATGMSGKWRQVGETPRDWGFDEYLTDPTAGGWFWQNHVTQNGEEVKIPAGGYAPDLVHDFAVDFLRRHKNQPFFLYYSMHHVHGPILRTPASAKDANDPQRLYQDNIRYMDDKVGAVVAELKSLGLRENTLVIFAGDNGTALNFPSTIGGRMINGKKASMLEGGSRVPFIASWPGTTPQDTVSNDLVSFADALTTFADLAGTKLPAKLKYDGHSIAPQLRGEAGTPREWLYVQLGNKWFVRNAGYKLNQAAELYDLSDAPFTEKFIAPSSDTDASKAARLQLTKVLADLNPAAGKTDADGRPPGKKRQSKAQPKQQPKRQRANPS